MLIAHSVRVLTDIAIFVSIVLYRVDYDILYSAPRLNGQRLSSHFLAVKAGWPIIQANLL